MDTRGSQAIGALANLPPEKDDVSVAPESGQPPGGPEDPWTDEDAGHVWPEAHHASPKDEL
jgi:hypothetical protein